jgi:hypothetical protein
MMSTLAAVPPPPPTRMFFPHAWLFEERRLSASGSLTLSYTVPDTVTNWTISAYQWAAGDTSVCAALPASITTFQR